jgi:hypothetical protein
MREFLDLMVIVRVDDARTDQGLVAIARIRLGR